MARPFRGHFLWHELKTTDPDGAAAFYGKVVGWATQASKLGDFYRIWAAGDAQVGGFMEGASPSWLPYIGTEDAEVAVWEAQRLGGKVIRDTEAVPSVGKFAVLQDPQGASFGVLQPENAPVISWPPPVRHFSWHELPTNDWKEAFRFYSALFGWQKLDAMDMGPPVGLYQMFGWKGVTLGGMYERSDDMPPPHWTSYIKVPDAKKATKTAQATGGQVWVGPMEVPGGDWITVGGDPQGAEFAIHSVAAPAPKRVTKPAARKRSVKKAAPKKAAKKKRAAPKRPAAKKAKPKARKRTKRR